MIDSHCHLTDKAFKTDRSEVIARAREAGITTMITIADHIDEIDHIIKLIEAEDDIYGVLGMHPHNAKDWSEDHLNVLKEKAQHIKVVAIGEIGLDFHYDNSPRDVQSSVFRQQLELAKELGLPAVVHTRDAIEETWEIVHAIKPEKLVVHCCTEQWDDVKRFVDAGYFLSFTGIATFPKAGEIRETIKQCPLEQLMIETDAPYLAPIPYRGQRCEPAHVVEVAKCVAEAKGISSEDMNVATTKHAKEFFNIA